MRTIALLQVYNEATFVERAILNRLPYVDRIIVTEGRLTVFGNMSMRSTDGTREIVERLARDHEKVVLLDPLPENAFSTCNNRERCEGINKNYMLDNSGIEHGDIVHVLDADEFYTPDGIMWIIEQFRKDDSKRQCWPEEWQFAYNLKLSFKARHGSRFLRFINGAHFGHTNHFFHGNYDLVKDKSFIVPRSISGVCHLSWNKHPSLIREKVVSFNRPDFTAWFNNVYLRWPSSGGHFLNNQSLQAHKLPLPKELEDFTDDFYSEIKANWRSYLI